MQYHSFLAFLTIFCVTISASQAQAQGNAPAPKVPAKVAAPTTKGVAAGDSRRGQKVIIRRPKVETLEINGVVVKPGSVIVAKPGAIVRHLTKAERLQSGRTAKVRKISDGWLWVRGSTIAGWVHQLDVIPFEKAVQDMQALVHEKTRLSSKTSSSVGGTAVQAYARGNELLDEGNFDQAIAQFTQVIQENPEIADAFNARGDAKLSKKEYDEAIKDFDQAIAQDSEHDVAHYNRGFAWHQKGECDRALRDYNRAIDINENEPWYYLQRGLCWYEKGEKQKAYEDHEMFVATKAPPVQHHRPHHRPHVRNPTPVLDTGPPIIELPPDDGSDPNVYWSPQELDEAIANFTEAIRLNPDFSTAFNGRGWAKFRRKRFEDAAADFDRAIELAQAKKEGKSGSGEQQEQGDESQPAAEPAAGEPPAGDDLFPQ